MILRYRLPISHFVSHFVRHDIPLFLSLSLSLSPSGLLSILLLASLERGYSSPPLFLYRTILFLLVYSLSFRFCFLPQFPLQSLFFIIRIYSPWSILIDTTEFFLYHKKTIFFIDNTTENRYVRVKKLLFRCMTVLYMGHSTPIRTGRNPYFFLHLSHSTISTITARKIFQKYRKIGVCHFLWPSITYLNEEEKK